MQDLRSSIKNFHILGAIFGAQAKKLVGLQDATHTVSDNMTFTAPDTITFGTAQVPNFLDVGIFFRITVGGGSNLNGLFKVLSKTANALVVDTSLSTVNTESSVLTTLDARTAIVINDETLAKINSKGNTIFNVNKCVELNLGNCSGILAKEADHFHDDPPGIVAPVELCFTLSDWFSTDGGDTYSIDIAHNFNSTRLTVSAWEGDNEVYLHQVRMLDPNMLRIKVTQDGCDCRFDGCVVIKC